jgi:hypothetical protein
MIVETGLIPVQFANSFTCADESGFPKAGSRVKCIADPVCSAVRYRSSFGTKGPQVQILPLRPFMCCASWTPPDLAGIAHHGATPAVSVEPDHVGSRAAIRAPSLKKTRGS